MKTVTFDPTVVGEVLGARLGDIEAAMERLASFAFVPRRDEAPPARAGDGELLDNARHLALRTLAALADTVNFGLLAELADGDHSLDDLASAASVPRLVLWERVNDLVQVGLVSRTLEGNRAGLTGAGQALVVMVEEMAAAAVGGRAR